MSSVLQFMTGRKSRVLQVPLVAPYKALEKFPKALYGTTGGTCSAQFFHPVMWCDIQKIELNESFLLSIPIQQSI